MIKVFKNSFIILKENMILVQPLILFLLVMMFAMLPLKSLQHNQIGFCAVLLNIILLTVAFLSGWFGMIKKTILNKRHQEHSIEPVKLLKDFFPCVGEYFLPMCVLTVIYILITVLSAMLFFKVATFFFNDINLLVQVFNQSMQPVSVQKDFIASLSNEQLFMLNKMIFYFAFCYFILNMLLLFYPSALFFSTKNPVKALWKSVVSIFKKPLKCVGVWFFLTLLSFAISLIGLLGNINLLLSFVTLFISLMFMTYYVVVLFLSYEEFFNSDYRSDSSR